MGDLGVPEFIEWLKKTLPAKLRVPFTTGVMLLVLVGIALKFEEGFEWPEVFRSWWFLLAVSLVCLYEAITVVWVRKSISWPGAVVWSIAVLMLIAAAVVALYGAERRQYRYDAAGFYASRTWMRDLEHGPGFWEWTLEPTSDLSKSVITVQMEPEAGCDLSRFDGPSPVRSGQSTHAPRITDASSLEHPNTDWKVRDLHQGEELVFRLRMKNAEAGKEPICIRPLVALEGK